MMSGDRVDDQAEDVELHDASFVCRFSNRNDKLRINFESTNLPIDNLEAENK